MKIVMRRELFYNNTYTELSITVFRRRILLSVERPKKRNDISFHWMIGR